MLTNFALIFALSMIVCFIFRVVVVVSLSDGT